MAKKVLGIALISYHLEKWVPEKDKTLVRKLLYETCEAIPAPARDSIIKHWKHSSKEPVIVGFIDHLIDGFKPRTGGKTLNSGRLIIYRHDYLLTMPVNLAKALIAHEFAHAYVCSSIDELRRIKAMAEKGLRCEIPFDGTWDQFGLDPDSAESNFRVVEGQFLIFKESFFMKLNEKRVRQINREWGFDEDGLSQ